MSFSVSKIPSQQGKTIVITGANGGLGFESALGLAKAGARVVLACRRPAAAEEAKAKIASEVPDANLDVVELDVSSLASVAAAAEELKRRYDGIDVLLNNAGVMALPARKTADGFEMQLGTNHFGHYALTAHLLEAIRGRVVTISSLMHRVGRIDFDDLQGERRYDKWKAYSQSKLANLLFSSELARRAESKGILSVAAHPGYSATNLQTAGPQMAASSFGEGFYSFANRLVAQPAWMGALPQLYAATMPDVRNDDYWGPGTMEIWGRPKRSSRSRAARDTEVARRLWDVTGEQTGVRFGLS